MSLELLVICIGAVALLGAIVGQRGLEGIAIGATMIIFFGAVALALYLYVAWAIKRGECPPETQKICSQRGNGALACSCVRQ
jgi:hypothetical protein